MKDLSEQIRERDGRCHFQRKLEENACLALNRLPALRRPYSATCLKPRPGLEAPIGDGLVGLSAPIGSGVSGC